MDISKLSTQIIDPASKVENLVQKLDLFNTCLIIFSKDVDFRHLSPSNGLGKVLLTVKRYPNIGYVSLSMQLSMSFASNWITFANDASLITCKAPKTYKGNNPGYRLTKLGMDLLKQNNLI